MIRRSALVLLVALALATAGCLADDGGGDATAENTDENPSSADAAGPDDGAGTDGANETTTDEGPTGPWWNVTWTNATVEGTNAGAVSLGPPFGDPNQHFFNVTQGALNLTLNFTTQDGEIWVTIYEPDCEDDSNFLQDSDCSHRADTGGLYYDVTGGAGEDGRSQWTTEDPKSGTWRIQVYKGDTGTNSVDYTIEHAILQPGEG